MALGKRMLDAEDIAVVAAYFAVIITVGTIASCRAARGTVTGYFLAGRNMHFIAVGASLFVSNIGSEHFVGLAGSGAASGIGVGAWEFNAILLLQLLGWIFIPVYIACQTYTMPEYLNKRFGGQRLRVYFAFLSLVLYIFTKTSVDLYTGALFIQQSLGWDLYLSIIILIVVVGILTITGGLTAVIYTDTIQAFLMVGGAVLLTILGFRDKDIGGFNGLWRKYPNATPTFNMTNSTCPDNTPYDWSKCGGVNSNWNIMLRSIDDKDMPWLGFLLGQTPASIWYWCADQVIVQRALAAKSLAHAQAATLMAAFIKITPLFIMVMPGMISRVKFTNEVACVNRDQCWEVCQSYAGCTNIAYPRLVLGIMPKGLRGLMMAVIIAALMSDLDSIFNSASSLFTIDIYKRIRKNAGVKELMIAGRLFIIVMIGVAIAWVPVIKETQGGQIFIYIQEITDYFAPPVACVYLLAVLWPRCNEQGAFWGLMAGLLCGMIRLVLIFVYRPPETCACEDHRPAIIKQVHFMYFALILSVITVVVTIIVSYATKPPTPEQLYRTTFWTRYEKEIGTVQTDKQTTSDKTEAAFDNPAIETENETPSKRDSSTQYDLDDKGIYTIETTTETKTNMSTGDKCKKMMISWLCGFTDEQGVENERAQQKFKDREARISTLDMDPRAKFILRIGLFVILVLGTALYIFWSEWKYTPPPG